MATGVVPFAGTTSAAVFDAILNKHPVAPLHLHPVLAEELDHSIRKALERIARFAIRPPRKFTLT
jgi:eukaryotic-like serine/threonine-protein kinase